MKSFFTTAFLLLTLMAQAQVGRIQGRVTTNEGNPADYVNVVLKGTGKGASSNAKGEFELKNVTPGNHTLIFRLVGQENLEKDVTVESDQTARVDVQLNVSVRQLNEVSVVSAAQKFARKQSDYVARLPISNLENPQVYTVVPKELIQEQIAIDLRSALTAAPGLNNIAQSIGSGGVGIAVRTRGFSGNGGSIRNGMSTNFVTMSDPINLESIEVIKGPSATLFGSTLATYGGLVNRVTKKPLDYVRGEVSYSTGSWSLSRTTIDYNTPLNADKTMLFRVNAALDNQKTWQDFGRSNTLVVVPSFTYKVNDRLTLDVEAEIYQGSRNATYYGLGSPGPKATSINALNFDITRSYTTDDFRSDAKNTNIFARATYRLSDQWVSQTNYSNAYTENKANYLFLLMTTDTTMQRRLMNINSIFKVSQIQQNFIGDFRLGRVRNRLLLGIDYSYLGTNDNRWIINSYDVVKINRPAAFINQEKYAGLIGAMAAPSVVNNRDQRTLSFYASDVINLTDQLLVMASVRVDNFNNKIADYQQTAVSPKFGLVYQLVKDRVSLFGNYMNGFTNVAPGTVAADPARPVNFKPEHANQLEGGIKVELLGGKLNGTLSYYDIRVENKVRPDPSNPTFFVQDGTQQSRGFEADLIANPARGLHLIFGYGHNYSVYSKAAASVEGKRPYATPANVANLWISYRLMDGKAKGLGLGFGGNTQSDSYLNDANTFTVNGYTTLDGTVFLDRPRFRFGMKLNNITNQHYFTSDFWANVMPTRQFIANLTLKF